MADNNKLNPRNDWWNLFDFVQQQTLHDKPRIIADYMSYMFLKCLTMFEWKGLPKTVPQSMLELGLMRHGKLAFIKNNKGYWALFGNAGTDLDPYYFPQAMTLANPYTDVKSVPYVNGKDCIIMRNDPLRLGLTPLFFQRAGMLAECDVTLIFGLWKERLNNPFVAEGDKDRKDIERFIQEVVDGKQLSPIVSKAFINNQKGTHFEQMGTQSGYLKDIMELRQYFLASWNNDVGLQSNFNMKREALNSEETGMNEDSLLPLVDEMLRTRKEDAEAVNSLFGLDISVDLSSAWKKRRENTEEKKQEEESNETQRDDSESA